MDLTVLLVLVGVYMLVGLPKYSEVAREWRNKGKPGTISTILALFTAPLRTLNLTKPPTT